MRDMRDPQKLGELLLKGANFVRQIAGGENATLSEVWDGWISSHKCDDFASNESCIEKYGRADEVEPRYAEIRVR